MTQRELRVVQLAPAGSAFAPLAAIEDSQPHRRLVWRRRFDAMFSTSWNEDVVAGLHFQLPSPFERQHRLSFQHDDPFVLGLVVPEAIGAAVTSRHDSLNANVIAFREDVDKFCC